MGRPRTTVSPEIVIAPGAAERLDPEALLVADANTIEAAGVRTREQYVFEARSGLHAGPAEVAEVRRWAARSTAPLVAVGSGTLTDIVRYAAHELDRDFISVPTAASMDGYASGVAALQIDGVKVTKPARAPIAILADPRVVAAAPVELTRSGIGDLLGKVTARVDWLAGHLLYGEPFDAAIADRVLGPLRFASSNATTVLAGDPEAITHLLSGLIESGVAMALAGNSRPASGCEHHASHFWDLLASRGRLPAAPHGIQVGYATRFAMRLQRFAFGGGVTELRDPVFPADPLGAAAREWLGDPPSADIVAAVEEKRRFASAGVTADWPAVTAAIAPALALFDDVERALDDARIDLGLDPELLRATFRYATRLRGRYTTIDFLEGQGLLEAAIAEALIDRAGEVEEAGT